MDFSFVVKFILLALAVYRAAELIALDDGPRDIFLKLRIRAGTYDRDAGGRVLSGWGRLIECPYCVGLWLALPATIILMFVPFASAWLVVWFGVLWLALAGAQAFLETIGGRAK